MLRPCRCSGSVSYVHLDCLNQWRATSSAAYFTCNVCKYNYRIERTVLAKLLTNEKLILVASVCFMVMLSLVLGVGVDEVIRRLEYDFNPMWLRCNVDYKQRLTQYIINTYKTSGGFNAMIKQYIKLLQTGAPMIYFVCNPLLQLSLRTFLLGAMPLGVLGFASYILRKCGVLFFSVCVYLLPNFPILSSIFELLDTFMLLRGLGFQQGVMHAGLLGMWLVSLGFNPLARLCLVVGGAIAIRQVYGYVTERARLVANRFGDMILEPNT
jgi:hypothetical protein